MFHALFILALIIVLGPIIIQLLIAAGFAIGAGVAVAGENICGAIWLVYDVTLGALIRKVGAFPLAMAAWLLVGGLLALGY